MYQEQKFERDEACKENYSIAILKGFQQGYMSLVADDQLGGKETFISHNGVYKRGKSKGKFRVMYDAAA